MITDSYAAGFIDADGNISLQLVKKDNNSVGYVPQPIINITQSNIGRGIHREFSEYANSMNVKFSVSEQEKRTLWRVQSTASCRKLLSVLRPHLVVKRTEADIMLESILPAISKGQHNTRDGFLWIMKKKEELDEAKAQQSHTQRKLDLDYFLDKWERERGDVSQPGGSKSLNDYM